MQIQNVNVNPVKNQNIAGVQPQHQEVQNQPAVAQNVTAPIYDYPMQSVYGAPIMPCPCGCWHPNVVLPQPVPVYPPVVNPQVEVKADVAPKAEPKVAEKQTAPAPKVEAKDVEKQPAEAPKAEAKPEVAKEQQKVVNKKPEIVAPDVIKPGIDLDGLVALLKDPDYDEQADAMEAISEVAIYAPERAGELLDNKIIDSLLGIIEKETDIMDGVPKEKAERNKQYAMYTISVLQKLYGDEIEKATSKTVPMDEMIGMAGIVNVLKNSNEPEMREAAVASLAYANRKDYKNDMEVLMTEASFDKDANVKKLAKEVLENINKA